MKKQSVLAFTLGLGLAMGSLTGAYTTAQANQRPAEAQKMQMDHEKPMHDRMDPQEMLTLLQIDEQTFTQEADSGKSLAEIAAAHNVSNQAVVDLVAKQMNQHIDKRLADSITVDQANDMKTNTVEEAQKMVDIKPMGLDKKHGPDKSINDRQNHKDMNNKDMNHKQNLPAMLTLLQIDEQTFAQEQRSGKSLAEIAAAHNVSRQAVVDLIVKNMNQRIDKSLAEERITGEQANDMRSNAVERVQEMIDKNIMEHPAQP